MNTEKEKLNKELNPWLEIPTKLTSAGVTFFVEFLRLEDFDAFISNLQLFVLSNLKHIIEHHQKLRASHPALSILEKDMTKDDLNKKIFRTYFLDAHKRVVDEMLYCKTVDNWLTYISDVLALIFTERPEMLKSSEQVRLDYILQFKDTETMITALAERKVEKLAYLGVKELADYFSKDLNFSLVTDADSLEFLIEAVEIRNVIVHARGNVSKIFKNRLPNHSGELGKAVLLGDIELLRQKLYCIAMDIDKRAAEKWDIPFVLTGKAKASSIEDGDSE